MDIQRTAVIGAGLMGANIALEFAARGLAVTLTDSTPEQLDRAAGRIRESLQELADHGLLREPVETVAGRIARPEALEEAVAEADLVVEAISEDLDRKRELFKWLDFFAPPTAVLASNSSSLMPSLLARAAQRPERVLGAHYWNPAHLIPLIELVPGEKTDPDVLEGIRSFYVGLGKQPILVRRETPGFIGNRLQAALVREAVSLVEEGVATPEDIDAVVRASLGRRMPVTGVLQTTDLAGLDVWHSIARIVFPVLNASRDPGQPLAQRVEEGRLGVKTLRGWYEYTEEEAAALRRALNEALLRQAGAPGVVDRPGEA